MSLKKFLNIALLILFFVELSSNFLPAQAHQVLGLIFIALIVAHNVLNRNFYRAGLNRRRIFNQTTILLFASGILAILISGAALAGYFDAKNINWRSIHLGAAIFSTILLMIHLLKHIRGKKLYAATILAFIMAVGAIFGLPYVDRWFHKVEVNRSELLRGEKLNIEGKILIVYFSRVGNTNFPAEVDAVSGASLMIDDKKIIGNAQMIAELVQSIVGGEIFAIQTERIYPADYSETTKVAKAEFDADELPKLKNLPDVAAYDKIILIYPLWWSDLPKPVENFLRISDFKGKIYPVVTHGGGGIGNSIETLKKYAEIAAPLDIYSSDIPSSRKEILDWLEEF